MRKPLLLSLLLLLLTLSAAFAEDSIKPAAAGPFKIGWIGPLTGPLAYYNAGQAALLAEEDVNAEGGILGRKLQLIREDGQGKGSAAISAFQKLVTYDKVKYILGGHCTPESAALAPLAQRYGVIVLASVTSSPKLSNISPNFARLTYLSTDTAERVAKHAYEKIGLRSVGVIHEETDYAGPGAVKFKEVFEGLGGKVPAFFSYIRGETDYRVAVNKITALQAEAVYIGSQSQEAALAMMRQLREGGFKGRFLGNETSGNTGSGFPEHAPLVSGLIFAEAPLDLTAPFTKTFVERFKATYKVPALPYGIWTSEAYDAVRLLAKTINECGDDVEKVKICLRKVENYEGVSGRLSINQKGDGVRDSVIKRVGPDGIPVVESSAGN